jgi:hypothetical protein
MEGSAWRQESDTDRETTLKDQGVDIICIFHCGFTIRCLDLSYNKRRRPFEDKASPSSSSHFQVILSLVPREGFQRSSDPT